jgi:hypothetical protein
MYSLAMRTTVNLDDDVAAAVEQLRRQRGIGLSDAVNQLARKGMATRAPSGGAFRQRTTDLGLVVDVRNVGEALEQLDGPAAR